MSFFPDKDTKKAPAPKLDESQIVPPSSDPAWFLNQGMKNKSWFTWIVEKRLKEKRNSLIMLLGQPRTGKSYTAITLANKLDVNGFDVKDKVSWTIPDFITQIQNAPEGSCLIFDEAGAEFNSRNYQSQFSKMLNFILQTFGSRYVNVLMCLPLLNFTDKSARQLCTFSLIMMQRGQARVYSHWNDLPFGEPDRRYLGDLKVNDPNIALGLPRHHYLWPPDHTQETVNAPCFGLEKHHKKKCHRVWNEQIYQYESRKREYQESLFESALKSTKALSDKEKVTRRSVPELIEDIVSKPEEYSVNGVLSVQVVAAKFGISHTKAGQACALIKQKYKLGRTDNFKDIIESLD